MMTTYPALFYAQLTDAVVYICRMVQKGRRAYAKIMNKLY